MLIEVKIILNNKIDKKKKKNYKYSKILSRKLERCLVRNIRID